MKLNKFLVAAAAVAVLPLSVANAVEEAPVVEKPFLKVNPDGSTEELPAVTAKGTPEVGAAKVEFKGGVNGTGVVNEKAPYAEKGTPLVNEKPEYKAEKPAKPATPAKRVLPKTHAVK